MGFDYKSIAKVKGKSVAWNPRASTALPEASWPKKKIKGLLFRLIYLRPSI